tara:strand:+ start:190 stop:702 length:513 start_codon:yes stop_codon:yes gene_type:complete
MSKTGEDYRIWKNDNFIVESTIDMSLWNKKIINDFQKNLSKALTEIYEKSDIIFSNSKKSISLSFSGNKRIIELNCFYRKLSSATNVLSFPSHSKSNNKTFLGDIIFANETICEEAKKDNKSMNNHLTHLFIHGVLHLLGYDHETNEKAEKMESLEIEILSALKIENPYK